MANFDICIIGFGPTGAVAAGLLAAAGHSVVVVDRLTDIYDKPRAIALDHEIMRVFQNMGVIEEVLPYAAEYPASEYRGIDGSVIKRLDAAPPPYSQGWAPNFSFIQPPVEQCLREHAVSMGVTTLLGYEFIGLSQHEKAATVELRAPNGDGLHVTARFVIGADGANSTVRRLCGLKLDDLGFDEPWLVVDVNVKDEALASLPTVNVQYCEPSRPATYVVGVGDHRRWEIMLNEDEDPTWSMQDDRVWDLLARWVTPETASLWRAATYRFHAVVAPKWRKGRVFLAGDSAHQQPPFLGQGMCQGVRDAVNLCWRLDLVLRGAASEALLDSYGMERGDHVTRLTTIIKTLGRFVCERDVERARMRDAQLIAEMGGKVVTTFRQDIMPPLTTGLLIGKEGKGRGSLFPQPRLKDGRLMDDVIGLGFRLFLSGDTLPLSAIDPSALPQLKIIRVLVDDWKDLDENGNCITESEGILARWFDDQGAVAALVRPDNYVFGTVSDAEEINALLTQCRNGLHGHCK